MIEQGLTSASNLLLAIFAARLLGPEGFGLFSTIWLFILLINSLHQATVVLPLMSAGRVTESPSYRRALFTLQLIFLFMAIVIYGAVLIPTSLFLAIDWNTVLISAMAMFFYHVHDFYRRLYILDGEYKKFMLSSIVGYWMRFVPLVLMSLIGCDLLVVDIYLYVALSFFAGAVIGFLSYGIGAVDISNDGVKKALRLHWPSSKWLIASGVMQWTTMNYYILIAAYVLSPVAVGAIRMGQSVFQIYGLLIQAGENYIPVVAAKIKEAEGEKKVALYVLKVGCGMACFIGVSSPFVIINEDALVAVVFGSEYLDYSFVFGYFIVISLLSTGLFLLRAYLRVVDSMKPWFFGYVWSSVLTLIIAIPLESLLGIHGALLGVIVSQVIIIAGCLFVYARSYNGSGVKYG